MIRFSSLHFTLFASLLCFLSYGQTDGSFDEKSVERLLRERQKLSTVINFNDSYRIQIFTGSSEELKKKLSEFKKLYPEFDAVVSFNAPIYKLWVGSFRTRIEAERQLRLFVKTYKQALLIKPRK